ncbi:MAG TPA: hypothetical protein VE177_04005 [Candidatus Binatus sp.]|nr:hypothetical protein [Candidatus Binatus sp.]
MSTPIVFEKPLAEILVEGELSAFEEEALYNLLRRRFKVDPPSFIQFPYGMEDYTTRLNVTFHYPYIQEFFSKHLQENWREFKDLVKNLRYRRGNAGAAFVLTFAEDDQGFSLVFHSGDLDHNQMSSALDQVGYLTGLLRADVLKPGTLPANVRKVECYFDKVSDRWSRFQGTDEDGTRTYLFNEDSSAWDDTKTVSR